MAPTDREVPEKVSAVGVSGARSPWRLFGRVAALLALIVGAAALFRELTAPPEGPAPPSSSAQAAADAGPTCVELAPGKSYRIGPEAPPKPGVRPDAPDADPSAEVDRDDLLSPFAIVLGRATAHPNGFAVGVQGEAEGGTLASLVLVGPDGSSGSVVALSRSRGDLDPPVVAAAGAGFVVALIEPNAAGRAVRLARVDDGKVTWGAELQEGRDESLALDVSVVDGRGAVAWDALDADRSYVAVAGFSSDAVGAASAPLRVTGKDVDAEAPRLAARAGGFYLVYLAHGLEKRRESARPREPGTAAPEASAAPPREGKGRAEGDVDETRGGESVTATWLEVVLLDGSATPTGDALRVTPEEGHVVSFDVAPAPDGGLLVAYREEDSPTGAGGGAVRMLRVAPGGGVAESHAGADDAPSDGAPTLLPGWVAVPTLRGADLLARLGPTGMPKETIDVERSLGRGEPIAARGDTLLLAEPEGKAMRVRVVTCGERRAGAPSASAAP